MNRPVTIYNDRPRRDIHGNIVDAHEVCLEIFEGRFYLYGTAYGANSGFTKDNRIVCYSSPDLTEWTPHGVVAPAWDQGLVARPAVKYSPKLGKYVLWFTARNFVVGLAGRPEGPFEYLPDPPSTRFDRSGDFNLFVDDDGSAYLISAITFSRDPGQNHHIYIERLTDDLLNGTGEVCGPIAVNCEAPDLFRQGDLYYALFDNTCCFCPAGSGVRVYTASSPLGPFTYRGNINRRHDADPRQIQSFDDDTEPGEGRCDVIIPAQQAHVTRLPTTDGDRLIWIGDRWGSADDGVKGYDYTYWSSPLEFEPDGMIRRLRWEPSWDCNLQLDQAENFAPAATEA